MTKKELAALEHAVKTMWGVALFEQHIADDPSHVVNNPYSGKEQQAHAEHYKLLAFGGRELAERLLDFIMASDSVCAANNLVAKWIEEEEKEHGFRLRPQAKIEVIDNDQE